MTTLLHTYPLWRAPDGDTKENWFQLFEFMPFGNPRWPKETGEPLKIKSVVDIMEHFKMTSIFLRQRGNETLSVSFYWHSKKWGCGHSLANLFELQESASNKRWRILVWSVNNCIHTIRVLFFALPSRLGRKQKIQHHHILRSFWGLQVSFKF